MPHLPIAKLGKCPVCRYSLQGLPAAHRCPECGFAYDENTTVWRPLKPRAIFWGLGSFGGCSFLAAQIIRGAGSFAPLLLVAWIGLGLYLSWRCYSIYMRGQFLAVGPDGLHYRLQTMKTCFLAWDRIAGISPQRYDKLCQVTLKDQGSEVTLTGVFSSADEVMTFIDKSRKRLTKSIISECSADGG